MAGNGWKQVRFQLQAQEPGDLLPCKAQGQPFHSQQTEEPFIPQKLPPGLRATGTPCPVIWLPRHFCGQNSNNLIKVR